MKSSLIFLVMGFSLNSYSATIPAQTFSRANCKVYIPSFGYGYYNESISYDVLTKDLLTGSNHKMGVATKQKESRTGAIRQQDSGDVLGKRARAGYVDSPSDPRFWVVNGYHRETLDNGRKVYVNTVAQDCNLHFDQFY